LRRVVRKHLPCILLRLQMLTIEAGRLKEGLAIVDETFILSCILNIVFLAHVLQRWFPESSVTNIYNKYWSYSKRLSVLKLL